MSDKALRLGTRRSKLAMAQSGQVADAVSQVTGRPVELVEITTYGDTSREHLAQIGGTGVFVTALRDALVRGEVDFAVHSLKDLPTAHPEELALAAVPVREDPRDVIVARDALKLADLPRGARIGTGSPRRMAQLNAYARAHDLDIETVPIRGNVDTRIGKVAAGELDAVVVAAAGLRRLGRIDEASELLDPLQMLPAPAQGALAVECRAADTALAALLAQVLDDAGARAAVTAERAVLATLEAGCSAPVGALADVVSDLTDDGRVVDRVFLRAVVGTGDGALLRASATGDLDDVEKLGAALAAELLDIGGGSDRFDADASDHDAAEGGPSSTGGASGNVQSGVDR